MKYIKFDDKDEIINMGESVALIYTCEYEYFNYKR